MTEIKSRWQQEYDALPKWAQQLVRACSHVAMSGGGDDEWLDILLSRKEHYRAFRVAVAKDHYLTLCSGINGAIELGQALTAPWPPPEAPKRERRALNVVELAADGDDCVFDQPCAFGHRVKFHAVYCHNEAWPNSPRKCRRDRDEYRHEDCPGFVANPDFVPSPRAGAGSGER